MLVMDNRAFDTNIIKGLSDMVREQGTVNHKLQMNIINHAIYFVHANLNSAFLYFPNVTKTAGNQSINTDLLIGVDLLVDDGESLDKVLNRYSLEYHTLLDAEGLLEALKQLSKHGTLDKWVPPVKLYEDEEEDEEEEYSDDDLDDFLNNVEEDEEDDDEDYEEDDEHCEECGQPIDHCECGC
jgi:hypothetical protein